MKRFFILATAAIVALAACTKTEVVYTETPEEISFKTLTGAMTKANLDLDGNTTMGVFANFATDDAVRFTNERFISTESLWKGATTQYWPLGNAALNFVFYAPHQASNAPSYDVATKTLTIPVNNATVQTNWLYGATIETGSKNNPVASGKPLMNHLLAKVTISLTGGITINSATLVGTEQNETATIEYPAATPVWSNDNDPENMPLISTQTELNNTPEEAFCYVIPSDQTSLVLNYMIGAGPAANYTLDLSDLDPWEAGKHYIYNINVEPGEITFVPSVEVWTTVEEDALFADGVADIL